MKISNIKILLLLVLGAFTLTLPNTVRAEDSNEIKWFKENLRSGTIRKAGEADYSAEIEKHNKLEAEVKKAREIYAQAKATFDFKGTGAVFLRYVDPKKWASCGMDKALEGAMTMTGALDLAADFLENTVSCVDTVFEDAIKKAQDDLAVLKQANCPTLLEKGVASYKDYLENLGGAAWQALQGNFRNAGKKLSQAAKDVKEMYSTLLTEFTSFATSFNWKTFGKMTVDIVTFNGSGASDKFKKLLDDKPSSLCESVEYIIASYEEFRSFNKNLVPQLKRLSNLKKDLAVTLDMSSVKGELYVYVDPKTGKKFLFEKNGDTITSAVGVTKGCIPMPAKLAETQSCLFCPLFRVIFNAANDVATASAAKLSTTMAQILLLGFAIYVAFSVLKLVSSFTKQDGPKFVTELLGQAFKVFFAYILLIKIDYVYAYIISPVLSAGLEFGSSLLFEKGNTYATLKSCGDITVSGGIMPASLGDKIMCFIKAVQAELSVPQTIASSLMCVARNTAATEVLSVKFWDFGMMFQGALIYCFSWLISLAFAFYLIDATVRLGIVGALMPFLIACWPLKATSSYTNKGWEMFMNSFFTFVMLGLVVSVNVQLIGQGLTGGKGGFSAIEDALNGDKVQVLQELLDIGFGGFLVLIACCLFGFKLCGQAEQLAGKMAAGGFADNGAKICGLAASGAKAVTLGAGKLGMKAAAYAGEKTGITPALRQGRDRVLGAVGRAFGLGKSSGAAGGSQARAAAPSGGTGGTAQNTNRPGPTPSPAPTPAPTSQAQQTQNAGPRNGGNHGGTAGSSGENHGGNTENTTRTSGQNRNQDATTENSRNSSEQGHNQGAGAPTNSGTRQNLSSEDQATMDKVNRFIQNSQNNGSMSPGKVSDQQRQHIFDRIRQAEQANVSSRNIKGQGFSYQTDEVGQVDFHKKVRVNANDLSESDKHLYDSIQSRKANEASIDVDGSFAMAKAHQALGGDPYTFGKKQD